MNTVNNVHAEILQWKAAGRSIEDTYIYFKDYIEPEALIDIWEGA